MEHSAIEWLWADKDAEAVRELERRLARSAREQEPINYSDLVRGVRFTVAKAKQTEIREIDTSNWSEYDRRLIGDYLGFISYRTFQEAGFLASALAVTKEEGFPSKSFFNFAEQIGAREPGQDPTEFWLQQLAKAQQWYRNHPDK